jgi:hypothetical protein
MLEGDDHRQVAKSIGPVRVAPLHHGTIKRPSRRFARARCWRAVRVEDDGYRVALAGFAKAVSPRSVGDETPTERSPSFQSPPTM